MDSIEKAAFFSGKNSNASTVGAKHSSNVTMLTGTATSDSENGYVKVNMHGTTISSDDNQSIEIPTMAYIEDGDEVNVAVIGSDGSAKSLLVTGVNGGGDRTKERIDKLIAKVEEQYGVSDDPSKQPTSWSTTAPTIQNGKYIWTRSVITNSKGEQSTSDIICVNSGANASGDSIKSIDVEYYLSSSSKELLGGQWQTTSPEWEDGEYIWSRTTTIYNNGTVNTSSPVCIAGTGIPMTKIKAAIDTKIDDIDNGGENLIRNSNTFDFDGYGFVSSYVESGDKPIKTQEGRELSSTISGTYGNGISASSIPKSSTDIESVYVNDGTDIKQMEVINFKKAINHVELYEDSDGDLVVRIYK